ncbi:hypothetical protein DAEQUDRAFT_726420 [Daedalea quercina L-15889]|uniref:Uncharacterized protein n=1 Tax=Daedalea quercina L-15889 TaxID=1314783 RepID=A0A165QPC5_9APHY|nr:hypothetical protein DAEQUDRAFT_726420 [Daedalea quercina L-15889]
MSRLPDASALSTLTILTADTNSLPQPPSTSGSSILSTTTCPTLAVAHTTAILVVLSSLTTLFTITILAFLYLERRRRERHDVRIHVAGRSNKFDVEANSIPDRNRQTTRASVAPRLGFGTYNAASRCLSACTHVSDEPRILILGSTSEPGTEPDTELWRSLGSVICENSSTRTSSTRPPSYSSTSSPSNESSDAPQWA